jgi:uncharacterized repeat protein (TIGR01451 family)
MGRVAGILATTLVCLAIVPAAHAQSGHTGYFVTIAARSCDAYTDIFANKSRNNIMESLRNLGPDTQYSGQYAASNVNPTLEALSPQDRCRPLVGWKFTLGTGIAANKVNGPWGSLSVVSNPYGNDITTQTSVVDRNDDGSLSTRTLAGATEVELSAAQLTRAQSGGLWIQGGTPADPVLDKVFPSAYAFGALRCATDNVNGDNVEYIAVPTKRVYCFAYYVQPPPTSGTIIIRKRVTSPANATQKFTFEGNLSYEANHQFSLQVTNGSTPSMVFYRAQSTADPSTLWSVDELVPAGWRLSSVDCTAGGSGVTHRPTGVTIDLHPEDVVTCTFNDALAPPPTLALSKLTLGGVGTFPFTVVNSAGAEVLNPSATTTAENVATPAVGSPFMLPAGTYTIDETLPRARGGRWSQTAVNCNAVQRRPRRGRTIGATFQITATTGAACVFENTFVPSGSIAISKVTEGGVGTTGFVITALDEPGRQYFKSARTVKAGRPALARGDSTRRLPLGRYVIQETTTAGTDPDQLWHLETVDCGGRLRPFSQGQVQVTLTADSPRRLCRFTNVAGNPNPSPPKPQPSPEPEPTPEPPPTPAETPQPDLVLTKRAVQSSVRVGQVATFSAVVRNTGDAAAHDVVLADETSRNGQIVAARPSQGSCNERTPLVCRLGTIPAGGRATVRIRTQATNTPGMSDFAVVGSASAERQLNRANTARASVRVRARGVAEACLRLSPIAHIAC